MNLRTTRLNVLPEMDMFETSKHQFRKKQQRDWETYKYIITNNQIASYRATVKSGARGLDVNDQKDEDQHKQLQHDASTRSRVRIHTMLVG